MAPGPRQPILLFGFDWSIQKEQDFSTIVWGAVFLRRIYTDENEEIYRYQRPDKQLEIKYGNNIAVMFMAMVHLAPYRRKAGFWEAIGLGFGASREYLSEAASILERARRTSRYRPGKHTAPLLDVADEWIDIVDGRIPGPAFEASLSDPDRLKAKAREFYASIERDPLRNMAKVPYDAPPRRDPRALAANSPNRPQPPGASLASDSSTSGVGVIQGIDPARISNPHNSSPVGPSLASRITRKRSFSPLLGTGFEHPSKRLQFDAASPEEEVLANVKAPPPSPPTGPKGKADATQPSARRTASHAEKQQHDASHLPPARRHSEQGAPSSAGATTRPTNEANAPGVPSGLLTDKPHSTQSPTNTLNKDDAGTIGKLGETNRLLGLLLSKLDGKTGPAAPTLASRDSSSLQRIAEELQDIKGDVNALLRTLSAVSDSHFTLIDGVARIEGKMPALVGQPDGSSLPGGEQLQAVQDRDGLLQQQKELFAGLLKQQSEQFERFEARAQASAKDMEKDIPRHLDQLVQDTVKRSVERPLADLREQLSAQVAVALEKPEPRTWGMQLAALEEDTKRHLFRIDRFYRKPGSQALPHVDANFIPDLMMAMQDIIKRAQAGQNN